MHHRLAQVAPYTRRVAVALDPARAVDASGAIEGYGSAWRAVDSYGDIVMPGAFLDSLARHVAAGTFPKMLYHHDPRRVCGVWDEMDEDDYGLAVRGRLLDGVQDGREAATLIRAGAIDGLSIGYDIGGFSYLTPDEARRDLGYAPEGAPCYDGRFRLVHSVDLWEISVVTYQACLPARVHEIRRAA